MRPKITIGQKPRSQRGYYIDDCVVIQKSEDRILAAENTIEIRGPIGEPYGVSEQDVTESLQDMDTDKELTVVINSPGGSVFDAISIHNKISEWPSKVITTIVSEAYSAASMIFMVGDERKIADNAMFMVHRPWMMTIGNADDLRNDAKLLDKTGEMLLDMYVRKSNLSRTDVEALLKGEDGEDGTWMNAQETLDAGFATSIVSTSREQVPSNHWQRSLATAKIDLTKWN